jgi:hypothetical protein
VARTCIFCGGLPLTREHVIADWISRALVAGYGAGHRSLVGQTRLGRFGAERPLRWDQSDSFDQRVRKFCARCNHGWMSTLEADVRPLLESMFWGKQAELSSADQTMLARWATKTALVAQSIEPPPDARPVIQADWLKNGEGSPPRTWVGLAMYSGRRHGMSLHVQAYRAAGSIGPPGAAGEFVIIRLERLVIVTFLWDGPLDAQVQTPPRFEHALIQVWPASPLIRVWPPTQKLSEDGMAALYETPPLILETLGI